MSVEPALGAFGAVAWSAAGPFERRTGQHAGAVRYVRADGADWAAVADAPTRWPSRVQRIRVEHSAGTGMALAALDGPDGELRVALRSWSAHEPATGLYDAALAGFSPTDRERRVVRWLLRLLRLPGAARLIRAWHAGRGR